MTKIAKFSSPPRAVIYTRVSRDQQEDNTSLAGQFAVCQAKAKEIGASIHSFYEETESGGLYLARPELQKALADIEGGRANLLVISRLDRTGRDVDGLRDIRRRIERAGGQLVFADGMQFDRSAVGDLMFTQLGAYAEFERSLIRERMVSGLRSRAQSGIMVARTLSPYGYHVVNRNDTIRGTYAAELIGQYVVIEEQAVWARSLFERYGAGHSLRGIANWLHEQGVITQRGGRLWRPATLRNMILNPVYKGKPAYAKTQRMVDEKRLERGLRHAYSQQRPEAEWIHLSAPPLVSVELWQACNDRLVRARDETSGRNDRKNLLTGLLRCPLCGRRLYSRTTHGRTPEKPRQLHYRCSGAVRRSGKSEDQRCSSPSCGGKILERLVIEATVHLLHHPSIVRAAEERYAKRRVREGEAQREEAELHRLERDIAAVRRRELVAAESLIEARLQGSDGSAFSRLQSEMEQKRRSMEARLEELQARRRQVTPADSPVIEALAADQIEAALLSDAVSPVAKGLLLGRLFERIYPVPVPSHLSGSARQARIAATSGNIADTGELASGSGRRSVGGVRLVLRTSRPGPFYILNHVLQEKVPRRDNSGRAAHDLRYKMELTIEAEDTLPVNTSRRAAFEDEL